MTPAVLFYFWQDWNSEISYMQNVPFLTAQKNCYAVVEVGRKLYWTHGIATVEPRNGTVAIAEISLVHFYGYCRHPRTNCSFETFFSLFYCECFANRHGNFSAIVTQVSHVSRLFVLSVSSFNREQADLKFMSYISNDNSNNENVKNKLFFRNTLGPLLLEVLWIETRGRLQS